MSDSEAIKYLTQRIDDIHGDVRYLRENVVTKDDCRERHGGIDRGLETLATRTELNAVKEASETAITNIEDDIDDMKKPLWAIVIAVAIWSVQWALGKLTG